MNNFIIDQHKFNELNDKRISDLTESTARKFLEHDTNVPHVEADIF